MLHLKIASEFCCFLGAAGIPVAIQTVLGVVGGGAGSAVAAAAAVLI